MKKRTLSLMLALTMVLAFTGCGKEVEEPAAEPESSDAPVISIVTDDQSAPTVDISADSAAADDDEVREGMYRSELTNEWIDEALKDQRPIAVMIDNEKTALPHYGVSQSDVVYEMTNSTANDGVTRLMVLFKDYNSIKQIGSIRSVRPTNLQICPEWNAVICHDGGPFYIDDYMAKDFVENFSGTFSRVNNGKSREFTEYILEGDIDKNFASHPKYSKTYNDYHSEDPHYQFTSASKPNDLSQYEDAKSATHIQMPYKHNKPYLDYDAEAGVYKYSEYGTAHVDPGNNNEQLTFKNLLIQNCRYVQFDANGYMMFHSIDFNRDGYYITNGKAIPVTWSKEDELSATRYYDKDGEEIVLNTGRTYVALVPDDIWSGLTIE